MPAVITGVFPDFCLHRIRGYGLVDGRNDQNCGKGQACDAHRALRLRLPPGDVRQDTFLYTGWRLTVGMRKTGQRPARSINLSSESFLFSIC